MSRSRRLPRQTATMMCCALALAAMATTLPSAQDRKLPITWSAPTTAAKGTAGAPLDVEVLARIDEGWHLYSLTQAPPPDPTVISLAAGQPFALSGTAEGPIPEKGFDEAVGVDTEFYTDAVSFRLPLTVEKSAKPGDHTIIVTARWQACNGNLCLRPQTTTIEVPVQVQPAK